MPAPVEAQILPLATAALQGAGLTGRHAPRLASALARTLGQGLALFLIQAQVMPGIPAAAPAPAGSGSTVGPGSLMPPPAGGPSAAQLEPVAKAAHQAEDLAGLHAGDLAKAVAATVASGIQQFTGQVKVAPGIAIAGYVTTGPGLLLPNAPGKAQLRPVADGFLKQNGLLGRNAPDLAGALAEATAGALALFAAQCVVAPGIACSPAATTAPGRLI